MIPVRSDITVAQGDRLAIPLKFFRDDGYTPRGTSRLRLRGELREGPTGAVVAKFKTEHGTERGEAFLILTEEVTSNLPPGWRGVWWAMFTLPDGNVITAAYGLLKVDGDLPPDHAAADEDD